TRNRILTSESEKSILHPRLKSGFVGSESVRSTEGETLYRGTLRGRGRRLTMLTAAAAVLAVSACGDEAEKGGSTEPASSDTATAGSADPETSSDGDGTPESSTDPYRVAVVADLSGG